MSTIRHIETNVEDNQLNTMDIDEREERRKHKRFPIKWELMVNVSKDFRCVDISEGGLYFSTENIFEENSFFDIEIPFANRTVTFKGQIRHFQPGIGVGIEFLDLNDDQKALLKEMIGHIEYEMSAAKLTGKKILLVEDHDMSREMNRINLHKAGFFVVEAKDGSEGVKMLSEYAPDLIILDLYMKDMDGFTVLKILKASPKWMNIPVLVFSSKIDQTIIDRLIGIGADDFLLKTQTSPAKLIETVESLLHRKGKD